MQRTCYIVLDLIGEKGRGDESYHACDHDDTAEGEDADHADFLGCRHVEMHHLPNRQDDGEQIDQGVGQGIPLEIGDSVDATALAGLIPEVGDGFALDDVCDLDINVSISS